MEERKLEAVEMVDISDETARIETTKDYMYCRHCGNKIDLGIKFCPYCGKEINPVYHEPLTNRRAKSKSISILLCLLLGVVGAHKFYEEKVGMGILYLFTGGLFGIGVLYDLVTLIFKSDPYYVGG